MLPIRANAGTVINENNPNNARELLAYYNREQYPETHLFYGPQFTEIYAGLDPDKPYKDDKPKYEKDTLQSKYIVVNEWKNAAQNTDDAHKALLPRMWSSEHAANYMSYTGGLEFGIKRAYRSEQRLVQEVDKFKEAHEQGLVTTQEYHEFLNRFSPFLDIEKPSFMDNIKFMFVHQFGYMYWRYFMWNFVGTSKRYPGTRAIRLHGNWLSGINIIDEIAFGQSRRHCLLISKTIKHTTPIIFCLCSSGLWALVFSLQKRQKELLGIDGLLFVYRTWPSKFI